ncbi:MAG TPA: hypothetical protein VFL36_12945 [Myxococcales bacterium]|nr:hypothetical protein [Myxococcales bacterium]
MGAATWPRLLRGSGFSPAAAQRTWTPEPRRNALAWTSSSSRLSAGSAVLPPANLVLQLHVRMSVQGAER